MSSAAARRASGSGHTAFLHTGNPHVQQTAMLIMYNFGMIIKGGVLHYLWFPLKYLTWPVYSNVCHFKAQCIMAPIFYYIIHHLLIRSAGLFGSVWVTSCGWRPTWRKKFSQFLWRLQVTTGSTWCHVMVMSYVMLSTTSTWVQPVTITDLKGECEYIFCHSLLSITLPLTICAQPGMRASGKTINFTSTLIPFSSSEERRGKNITIESRRVDDC